MRKHLYKVLIKTGYCTASDKNIDFLVMVTAKRFLFCTVLLAKVGIQSVSLFYLYHTLESIVLHIAMSLQKCKVR